MGIAVFQPESLASGLAAISMFALFTALTLCGPKGGDNADGKRAKALVVAFRRRAKTNARRPFAFAPRLIEENARLAGWTRPTALFALAFGPMIAVGVAIAAAALVFIQGAMTARTAEFIALLGAVGAATPMLIVEGALRGRRQAIARALPDALELMVMGMRAGLGVEAALRKTAASIASLYPELARELTVTLAELRFLPSRQIAYQNLGARMRLPELITLAANLAQAEQSGAPAADAVSRAALDMRDARMAEAERRAASLPAKLSAPLVLFFMPAIFVVVLVPALLRFWGGR